MDSQPESWSQQMLSSSVDPVVLAGDSQPRSSTFGQYGFPPVRVPQVPSAFVFGGQPNFPVTLPLPSLLDISGPLNFCTPITMALATGAAFPISIGIVILPTTSGAFQLPNLNSAGTFGGG
ncbi:hypothetical protein R1flu_023252 [Riccia fluitans]|uniref:Uncharacterized protein n=1 Tax=Riccia fluitans TaxID=41844 RepID=A0ABD1XS18_9MARC